nr:hypothetical protein [Tanacetum cinerariifolium]
MRGTSAQTRSERVLEQPNEPPLTKGHTSESREGRLEENIELTDIVPTPHDSPLGEGSSSGLGCQETIGGAMVQVRPEGASIQSRDPPLITGNIVRNVEDRMEHKNELTDHVPQIPHDSPLSRGYTPGNDEGSMTLKKLTDLRTTLSQK